MFHNWDRDLKGMNEQLNASVLDVSLIRYQQ